MHMVPNILPQIDKSEVLPQIDIPKRDRHVRTYVHC